MSNLNFAEDTRALMFVRQFHNKRIVRFLKNKPFHEVEGVTDLRRSKDILLELSGKLNG